MATPTLLRIVYQVGRLGWFFALLIPYVQWKTWKAKSAFKAELVRSGVPARLASNLADSYDNGNKNLLLSIVRQPPRFRREAVVKVDSEQPAWTESGQH